MKKFRWKKKVIVGVILFLVLIFLCIGLYGFSLRSVSKNDEVVSFTVQNGRSKIGIIEDLKTAGLIRSKTALIIYLYFNDDMNLQAGKYDLNRNMSATDILKTISSGNVKEETVKLTFVEGKNMNDFIKLISENFSFTENEIKEVLASKEFIEELIEKYDFLTNEVLNDNIYYALEGYLFPDTYEILENSSLKDIIIKMLDNTRVKLDKIDFSNSNYSVHEILTMASIIELEVSNDEDKPIVSQVFWKKMEIGDWLGSCVTAKYSVGKSMKDNLTWEDLNSINYYNTYAHNPLLKGKLPVGPIGSVSLNSINAALNPSDTDYLYFIANLCTGETYFSNNYNEHLKKQVELKRICDKN